MAQHQCVVAYEMAQHQCVVAYEMAQHQCVVAYEIKIFLFAPTLSLFNQFGIKKSLKIELSQNLME